MRMNLFAVNFNRRNPKTVGIIVPSLLDPFYAALVQRIEFQASAAGYWTVIQSSQGDPDREAEAVATLVSTKSAGAIVAPLGEASRKDLYRQMEKAMPIVFLDARVDADEAFVGTDNLSSMSLMVDYLLRSARRQATSICLWSIRTQASVDRLMKPQCSNAGPNR
jgi:LacI family transcriptional regulator, repressor for deo operon, udp, cdd, tsx, nupC, and nupG